MSLNPGLYETGSGGFIWKNILTGSLLCNLRTHVYYAYEMHVGKEWAGSDFVNHYNRIYYVESGTAVLQFKDFEMTMKPGHLYLIPPYTLVSHYCEDKLHFYWTHFHTLVEGGVDLFLMFDTPMEIRCANPQEIKCTFSQLAEAAQNPLESETLLRNILLLKLLAPFMANITSTPDKSAYKSYQQLLPALSKIEQNLDGTLNVSDLAYTVGLSPEHFSRRFKSEFNISPKRYILQKRISLAKQMLSMNDIAISEVGSRCGFNDSYHFSNAFKHETGYSPSNYRKSFSANSAP